jgi:hypothetical protein
MHSTTCRREPSGGQAWMVSNGREDEEEEEGGGPETFRRVMETRIKSSNRPSPTHNNPG